MDMASACKEAAQCHEQEQIDKSPINKNTMREDAHSDNQKRNDNTKECVIKNDNVHTKKMQQKENITRFVLSNSFMSQNQDNKSVQNLSHKIKGVNNEEIAKNKKASKNYTKEIIAKEETIHVMR